MQENFIPLSSGITGSQLIRLPYLENLYHSRVLISFTFTIELLCCEDVSFESALMASSLIAAFPNLSVRSVRTAEFIPKFPFDCKRPGAL